MRPPFWEAAQRRQDRVVFVPEVHAYLVDGGLVPGVTTVLQDADFFKNLGWTVATRDRGSRVHKATEALDRGELEVARALVGEGDASLYLKSYQYWMESTRPHVVASEWTGVDQTERVAGTLDRLAYLGTQLAIIDIKTGGPQPWHALQTAGYARIVAGDKADTLGRYGLYLHGSGLPATLREHTNLRDFATFDAAVEIWHARAEARSDVRAERQRYTHEALSVLERGAAEGDASHGPEFALIALWQQRWKDDDDRSFSPLPLGSPLSARQLAMAEPHLRAASKENRASVLPFPPSVDE